MDWLDMTTGPTQSTGPTQQANLSTPTGRRTQKQMILSAVRVHGIAGMMTDGRLRFSNVTSTYIISICTHVPLHPYDRP
jgi:hypothetical protein